MTKIALPSSGVLSTDICVVGAGPAGIAVAEYLAEQGREVCLLESGFLKPETPESILTDQRPIGAKSRIHAFGGTTKVWAGRWKLLDPIDFTQRDFIPLSGWPFGRDEMNPFYAEAAQRFGAPEPDRLSNFPFSERTRTLCSDSLEPTAFWTFPKNRLDIGAQHIGNAEKLPKLKLLLGAVAVRIERSGKKIISIHGVSREGAEFNVEARTYVLAMGGIENARLLLLSEIGGSAVGRYFMDHPKGIFAVIKPAPRLSYEPEWLRTPGDAGSYRVGFRAADNVQQSQKLLNSYLQLEPIYPGDIAHRLLRFATGFSPLRHIAAVSYWEQLPSAENRITLLSEKDAFGMPRSKLSWKTHPADAETIVRLYALLRDNVEQAGIGTLDTAMLESAPPAWTGLRDASHHMGTTRMGSDPETSVVDADAKVHGLDNLYIAGSSVFPTSGHANPTATILALALRLGRHLAYG